MKRLTLPTKNILAVLGRVEPLFQGGAYEEICILFEDNILQILPDGDTDELILCLAYDMDKSGFEEILPHLKGQKITDYWHCYNSRGYFDNLLIAYNQLQPCISILSEGNSLKIFELRRC